MDKKTITKWIFISFIYITIICIIFGDFIYNQLTDNYFEKISQIISTGVNYDSNIEQHLISSLKNKNTMDIYNGKKILKQYGYFEDFNNYKIFQKLLTSIIILIISLFSYLVLLVLLFQKKKRTRIRNLADYIYDINNGIYKMKPEKKEDDISIIEDELFKTIILFREGRERERVLKENLCNNLADISHQLKTPLTSISLMIELLEDSNIKGDESLYIKSISTQVDRLNSLVSSLLILSKIDSGVLNLKHQSINVSDLIYASVESLNLLIEKKNQTLFIEKKDHNIFFYGDFYWSSEAILNIVKNCYEHTPKGGLIYIDYKQNPIYTQITIEDNGKGFDSKDIPNLFKRFYKGKNSPKDNLGIGLALANSIIKKQNGEIIATNKNSGGAKFIIKFYKY